MDQPGLEAKKKEAVDLLAGMLNRTYYAIINTPKQPEEAIWEHLADHLRYMLELEEQGILFGSGPFIADTGRPDGKGMTIVRAASREEAAGIAEKDPLYLSGFRDYEILEWRLMEGSLRLKLDLSNQTVRFE